MQPAVITLNEIKTAVTDAVAEQLGDLPIKDIIDTRARLAHDTMLRIAAVADVTGLSKATIYALEADGEFPKRVPLTSHTSAWSEAEVQDWIAGRKNSRDLALRARGRSSGSKQLKKAIRASAARRAGDAT